MFIKVKRVELKSGRIQEYYYLVKSVRKDKQPRQIIIKYLGKTIPEDLKY